MLTLYCMTHKVVEDRRIPKDRTMMLVGAYNKDIDRSDYIKDDLKDNISNLNSSFCELTGLYSIWKMIQSLIMWDLNIIVGYFPKEKSIFSIIRLLKKIK